MKLDYAPGATPLDHDEMAGLLPSHITTHEQLNEWEAANIISAEKWLYSLVKRKDYLSIDFIKSLHRKMFDGTWKWAGQFRTSEKKIGVAPSEITTELKHLLDDVK